MVSFWVDIQALEDGGVKVKTVSILEDYWHDYLHFKMLATTTDPESQFLHRCYLRGAFLTLMAYAEGVVNRWWSSILKKDGKTEREIDRLIRQVSFYIKCDKLTKKALLPPNTKRNWSRMRRL
jgi:hypothetical protein